ncbi:MAG: DUF4292 domain-containing protein [Thermodesulfobacteriota bacterium]
MVTEVIENHNSFNSIRAVANISILNGTEKIKFRQVTLAKKDNFIRIEALAVFGTVIAQIFCDSEKVYLTTRYEQVVFDNTRDFKFAFLYPDIPEELGIADLVNIVLANPPSDILGSEYRVSFDGNIRKMKLEFEGSQNLSVIIDPEKKVIEKVEYVLTNGERAEIEYGDFKQLPGGRYFPKNIQLKSNNYNLSITYNNDLEVNPILDISIFQPKV